MDPFFKWAGGKKRMIKKYNELNLLPKAPSTVIEPFCGGAAMSLHLMPEKAYLNDCSIPVWMFWACVANNPQQLIECCKELQTSIHNLPVYYAHYEIKKSINMRLYLYQEGTDMKEDMYRFTADFLFLNKHGYNGLWRVNNNGQYNVPYGKYRTYRNWIPRLSDLIKLEPHIVEVDQVDFEDYLEACVYLDKEDTFIYIDPPYWGTFDKYNRIPFTRREHVIVREVVTETYSNAKIAISSIDVPEYRKLWHDWNIHSIPSKTTIQGEGSKVQNELLITNY